MEAKKSKKAAIENQRGSWLLMGLVVALAFMFVSFEWTQHDVRVAALSSDDESIFVTELVPITFPEEKLEPPPPPETKVTDLFEIVDDTEEVTDNVSVVPDNVNEPYKVVWVPPVVETAEVEEDVIHVSVEIMPEFPGGSPFCKPFQFGCPCGRRLRFDVYSAILEEFDLCLVCRI